MKKYIDAGKLIAEIERLTSQKKTELEKFSDEDYTCSIASSIDCKLSGNLEALSIIKSLQQEQPKVDLVAELKQHLAITPKEQLEKEWKELEPWGNIGPTVQEFLYGKQSEVDLENEIREYIQNLGFGYGGWVDGLSDEDLKNIARHFYELGKNSK